MEHSCHVGDAFHRDNSMLCLLTSITHSLRGLNDKPNTIMEEESSRTGVDDNGNLP